MPSRRLLASGALVLVALVVLIAIGLPAVWNQPPSGYRGTIYLADRYGVWKMRFPELAPVRLVSQDLFDPRSLTLSPNQQWLTYWTDDYSDPQDPGNAQWVLSTHGGTPQKVNRLLGQGDAWLGQHQLVYMDYAGAFILDPETGRREKAERWHAAPSDGAGFAGGPPVYGSDLVARCEMGRLCGCGEEALVRRRDRDRTRGVHWRRHLGPRDLPCLVPRQPSHLGLAQASWRAGVAVRGPLCHEPAPLHHWGAGWRGAGRDAAGACAASGGLGGLGLRPMPSAAQHAG